MSKKNLTEEERYLMFNEWTKGGLSDLKNEVPHIMNNLIDGDSEKEIMLYHIMESAYISGLDRNLDKIYATRREEAKKPKRRGLGVKRGAKG